LEGLERGAELARGEDENEGMRGFARGGKKPARLAPETEHQSSQEKERHRHTQTARGRPEEHSKKPSFFSSASRSTHPSNPNGW